jgi:hypothetical protein
LYIAEEERLTLIGQNGGVSLAKIKRAIFDEIKG